jgi:hypothetical protein
MARIKVTITRSRNEFQVRWARGLVSVSSRKQAEALKANIEAGMSSAKAISAAIWKLPRGKVLMPNPRRYANLGGAARAAGMTPEQRSASAKVAAAARWGKTVTVEPVAGVEGVEG